MTEAPWPKIKYNWSSVQAEEVNFILSHVKKKL